MKNRNSENRPQKQELTHSHSHWPSHPQQLAAHLASIRRPALPLLPRQTANTPFPSAQDSLMPPCCLACLPHLPACPTILPSCHATACLPCALCVHATCSTHTCTACLPATCPCPCHRLPLHTPTTHCLPCPCRFPFYLACRHATFAGAGTLSLSSHTHTLCTWMGSGEDGTICNMDGYVWWVGEHFALLPFYAH